MIVSITVVVKLVDDVPLAGFAPGESICPPKAEPAIASVRIVAAHVRRTVFIVSLPQVMKKDLHETREFASS